MNRKGVYQYLIIIIVVIVVLFGLGILGYAGGKIIIPGLIKHNYLDIEMNNNVTSYQPLQVNVLIKNAQSTIINPELEIVYDDSNWMTSNRYIIRNERIPVGVITPSSLLKYSIEFVNSPNALRGDYTFKFNLFVNNELVDTREEKVYVR